MDLHAQVQKLKKLLLFFVGAIIAFSAFLILMVYAPGPFTGPYETDTVIIDLDDNAIVDGIHVRTGLKKDTGLMKVVQNCTNCHSSKLLIQNRMNYDSWKATIKWMQETQNLWDLGNNEAIIINYLVRNYPVTKKGRRQKLKNIEWYRLN